MKIVVLLATAALLSGCGGGSGKKDACSPNATMSIKSSTVELSQGKDAEQKVLVKDGSVQSENSETVITLADGSVATDKSTTPDNSDVDAAADMIIDFAKKSVTLAGQTASFTRDEQASAAKGRDVFVTNEAETKAAVQKATNADPEAGVKVCSVSKASLQFSYDDAKKTVDLNEAYEIAVQFDAETIKSIKASAVKPGQTKPEVKQGEAFPEEEIVEEEQ